MYFRPVLFVLVCWFWLVFRTGSLATDVLPVSFIYAVLVGFRTGSFCCSVVFKTSLYLCFVWLPYKLSDENPVTDL